MIKGIRNANIIAYKLGSALTRATNHKLEVIREEQYKKEKMIKRQKTEAMGAKRCRDRGRFSLFSRKKRNHESDIEDDTDLD